MLTYADGVAGALAGLISDGGASASGGGAVAAAGRSRDLFFLRRYCLFFLRQVLPSGAIMALLRRLRYEGAMKAL
jgi:hypothetical protein